MFTKYQERRQRLTHRFTVPKLAACLLAVGAAAPAQTTLTYYFAHIAAADVWRTTFTYVNASTHTVTCATSFFSDSGSPLSLAFNGRRVGDDLRPSGRERLVIIV